MLTLTLAVGWISAASLWNPFLAEGPPLGLPSGAVPGYLGRAVLDPIKPTLKPPGTKHLKLKCEILLSTSAFKFNLRRYTLGRGRARA